LAAPELGARMSDDLQELGMSTESNRLVVDLSLGRILRHEAKLSKQVELIKVLVQFRDLSVLELRDDAVGKSNPLVRRRDLLPARSCQRSRIGPVEYDLQTSPVAASKSTLHLNPNALGGYRRVSWRARRACFPCRARPLEFLAHFVGGSAQRCPSTLMSELRPTLGARRGC
jgi:hypothetical protein